VRAAAAAIVAAACIVIAFAASTGSRASVASCSFANGIEHVVYLQFDNTHYRRDRPDVASDLQQMPHLLSFLQSNGTLFTNDHTVLIAHTAAGVAASLTGLYPDRNGQTVANSYGFFGANGPTGFTSSFKYWTDVVDAAQDPKPNMITAGGKTTPAPWVPFTRAGCDVGGVGIANIELENTKTDASAEITRIFGNGSPEWSEATASPAKAQADYVGIAIHCAQTSRSRCAGNGNARPDLLPDEPKGYSGFEALYGAKYVDPAIADGKPCVAATDGTPITDPAGNCGFPGFDGWLAKNALGYVAQMQEHGVPVTFAYISDAHDVHTADPIADTYRSVADGPGEAGHEAQLKAYDDAFATFFKRLAAHGIDRSNTLFVVTVDEGDHFAGGVGTPVYSHANCFPTTSCPTNQIGEVNVNLTALLPEGEPRFDVHSDDAPTVYLPGNFARAESSLRKLERDMAALRAFDPYAGKTVPLMVRMADRFEERTLHMVNADPARTPTFTYFGNDDFFFSTSTPACGGDVCVSPGFAWNHGNIQDEIGNTWAGIAGPGVAHNGIDARTWTDHTNLRPTILALLGLRDDYVSDGRVLTEGLTAKATPSRLRARLPQQLAAVYEQLNAPFGAFGTSTLATTTKAMTADDATYLTVSARLAKLTAQRDRVAGRIKVALWRAAFDGVPIGKRTGLALLGSAKSLVQQSSR
jgi:hypothetical protein